MNIEEATRHFLQAIIWKLVEVQGWHIQNVSDKYLIIHSTYTGLAFRVDVTPHIDTTGVKE